jgi:hypothetical protein
MKNHIFHLIQHWGDRCYSWDVVNEALADNWTWAPTVWYDTIGPEYFHKANEFATEAVKDAGLDVKLYYNDYDIVGGTIFSSNHCRYVSSAQRYRSCSTAMTLYPVRSERVLTISVPPSTHHFDGILTYAGKSS